METATISDAMRALDNQGGSKRESLKLSGKGRQRCVSRVIDAFERNFLGDLSEFAQHTGSVPETYKCLDLSAGDGLLGEELQSFGVKGIVGCSPSPNLHRDSTRLAAYSELVQQDFREPLSFEVNQFDLIACADPGMTLDPSSGVLGELVRVSRPGALIVLAVPSLDLSAACCWSEKSLQLVKTGVWEEVEGPFAGARKLSLPIVEKISTTTPDAYSVFVFRVRKSRTHTALSYASTEAYHRHPESFFTGSEPDLDAAMDCFAQARSPVSGGGEHAELNASVAVARKAVLALEHSFLGGSGRGEFCQDGSWGVPAGMRALDLCVGEGLVGEELGQWGFEETVGVDERRPKSNAQTALYSQMTIQALTSPLPFDKASFNVVTCAPGWRAVSREAASNLTLEAARVLRPGGVLVVSVGAAEAGASGSGWREALEGLVCSGRFESAGVWEEQIEEGVGLVTFAVRAQAWSRFWWEN